MQPIRFKYGFFISDDCLCGRCLNSNKCSNKDTVRQVCRSHNKGIFKCELFVKSGRSFAICPCDGVFK